VIFLLLSQLGRNVVVEIIKHGYDVSWYDRSSDQPSVYLLQVLGRLPSPALIPSVGDLETARNAVGSPFQGI